VKVPPALRYTTLRLTLFLGVLAALSLLRVRGILLIVLAFLLSGLVSYSVLNKQRDAMSSTLARRAERIRESIDESTRAEDEAADTRGDGNARG
jgi:hypothetical protein